MPYTAFSGVLVVNLFLLVAFPLSGCYLELPGCCIVVVCFRPGSWLNVAWLLPIVAWLMSVFCLVAPGCCLVVSWLLLGCCLITAWLFVSTLPWFNWFPICWSRFRVIECLQPSVWNAFIEHLHDNVFRSRCWLSSLDKIYIIVACDLLQAAASMVVSLVAV